MRTAAKLFAASSLAVATVLWVLGLPTSAPGLAAAGRLAALWSTDLLLLQVLGMARIPWLERAFGQDSLGRWHRWTGTASFALLLAHVALALVAYAQRTGTDPARQMWAFLTVYRGMVPATLGLLALVLVTATSLRPVRRRLRYATWHLLHLYAYAGIALAIPHELWLGSDFGTPFASAFWWAMYGAAAGSTVVFRLGMPVWRTLRHRLRVDRVVEEAPGLVSVYLRGRRLDRLRARAGQFFVWRFLDGEGGWRGNPYSLSGPPRADRLRITVKTVGEATARVAELRSGTKVVIEGPYGRMTADTYRGGSVTMFGCGVGVTPLLALLWDLPYGHGRATLVYRTRHAQDVAFLPELEWLARERGVRLVPLVGPRAAPGSWLPVVYADYDDIAALRSLAPDLADHDVYVCGPDPWTDAVLRAARRVGVPAPRLHRERFAW
ncbi:ferric reductase-like transmembrane domain-containing protein [Dactylosporangium sp. AC04546]|uniref:ferredoxin reductase family protein n=1 Tax=Dactylosporangium sp. AC04546 TaxID=2862460 RepID=UPI001EDE19B2|nr:ferric reductase-like transmembrane domain-containing protein [Dactylosporangium sp. AC04546]WVK79493.1 ferric reductase-like transmembrane domain-containing protein [Dactylosporangium sp. AC04546]